MNTLSANLRAIDALQYSYTQDAFFFEPADTSDNSLKLEFNGGFSASQFNVFLTSSSSKATILPNADTVPGTSATTETIDMNGRVTGTIEDAGDQDFYRIELEAGVTYEFFMLRGGDNPMEDPYLRLFDIDGVTQLAENDDIQNAAGEQATRNSKITFTATESRTYFLVADRWDPDSGPDLTFGEGDYTIYAYADGFRPEATLDELAFFLTDQFDNRAIWDQTTITYNLSALPAAVQTLALAAMELWADVTPLSFISTTSSAANLVFTDNEDGAFASTFTTNGAVTSAQVNVNDAQWVDVHGTDFNSYTFETYIHEVGHAIGLGHGGPYNGNATYGVDNVYANDLANFTIMSYNQQTPGADAIFEGTPRLVLGLQIADLIAIQNLYGDNPNGTRAGNTDYGFNSNAGGQFDFEMFFNQGIRPPALSIYDTGGYDTLDMSGYSAPQRISLIEETFSDVGNNTNLGGDVPLINIISIARGTVIEAAFGGSGDDEIIGNDADNTLRGNSGKDRLEGGGGNDTLTGGQGNDTFIIAAGSSDVITDFFAGDLIVISSAELILFTDLDTAAVQEGENVVIALGDDEFLTLENVTLADLSASDFEFTEEAVNPAPPTPDPIEDGGDPIILVNALDHIYFNTSPFM